MAPDQTQGEAMLEEVRQVAARQRRARELRALELGARRLLSQQGGVNGMAVARELVERLQTLDGPDLQGFFDFMARELSPDPQRVLQLAQAYADDPSAEPQIALVKAAEPPRRELLRRLNRAPGGVSAVLKLRRVLLEQLPAHPEFRGVEADLLHLLTSWFSLGFLQMRQVDWNAPAQLLEKLIEREAVHAIDGMDDMRRRLQPDRRCYAFFHPQVPDEPLIFVEVALVAHLPDAIGPLIDKSSPIPQALDKQRVACFYGISNCEPALRGVALGNFLIKKVAEELQRELPRLKTFCTLSPIPGFARWLADDDALAGLPRAPMTLLDELTAARNRLVRFADGDLAQLQTAEGFSSLDEPSQLALRRLCAAYLVYLSPSPGGDPVGRFHLDNGAQLERLNWAANTSDQGLQQSFGLMVNYLYDLGKIEASNTKFRDGDVVRSRAVSALLRTSG